MTATAYVARLTRLALALQLRDADVAAALTTVALATPDARVLVGAATQGGRIEILVDYQPGMLAALGHPEVVGARALRLVVDGASFTVATLDDTHRTPPDAVAAAGVGDAAAQAQWLDVLSQFCSIASGRIASVTRRTSGEHARIDVRYPARDEATDRMLVVGIDQLAEDLGVSPMQRRLIAKMHPALCAGRDLVVSTSCTQTVSSYVSLTYPVTSWDTAVRVGEGLVLNDSEAKQVPTHLGAIAGALGSDTAEGLELVLGPHEPPGVLVWARLAPLS